MLVDLAQVPQVYLCPFALKHDSYRNTVGNSFYIHFFLFTFFFSNLINELIGDLSASDTSLVDLVERHRGPLPPELMPLPSSDRDNLEWTHLVDVANTFETERNTHYGIIRYVSPFMWFILAKISARL